MDRKKPVPRALRVLVLQGGGALGSYQAGIFEGLDESGLYPDWVVGISIGAINAALIAGNPPGRRLERLRSFWEEVTSSLETRWNPFDGFRDTFNQMSAAMTSLRGLPGFFAPRPSPSWLGRPQSPSGLSVYDTSQLRKTLERLIDFDYLNGGETRLTIGAAELMSGNSVIFDTTRQRIGPEHIMASGALPPGLPPIEIDGAWYWDGGVVSNTPLQFVLNDAPDDQDLCIYQVDLFNARGQLPRTMSEVRERMKDIQYSSRTRMNTDAGIRMHKLKVSLKKVLDALPKDFGLMDEVDFLRSSTCESAITIIQLIYRKRAYEGGSRDFEFSRPTMIEHWAAGVADGRRFSEQHRHLLSQPRVPGVMLIDPGSKAAS